MPPIRRCRRSTFTRVIAGHPFEATLTRVGRSLRAIGAHEPRLGAPRGGRWTTLDALTAQGRVEELVERIRRRETGDRRDVAAIWFLERLVELIATPAVAGILTEQRLLDLSPRTVTLRFGADGYPAAWGVHGHRFHSTEGDPESHHADVLMVAGDENELLVLLRADLDRGLDPVVEELHVCGRRSRRALWRSASDVLASAFLSVGKELAMMHRATAMGERCLGVAGPMRAAADYRVVELRSGERAVTRVRAGCCLNHVVDRGNTCLPCPLTPPDERLRRLGADLPPSRIRKETV
jgi:ferric iron reductase protein FhuF